MRFQGLLYFATVSALALSAANACAQQASAQLEEVVVTAQKREQAINDIPLSITALTGSQLEERNISGVADLGRAVAGFTFADTGVNAPVYSLRGVGYFDYSMAASPAVSVYLDEVPLAYPAMTQGASFDLSRVEVLRGPQGTLFGQNATGGLVNFIANRPTQTPEAGISVGYGSFNRIEAEGYVSGPISDTLRGRLALNTVQSDDWQHSQTRNDTNGGENKTSGRAILQWEATPDLDVTFNLNGYLDKSDPFATQLIAITPLTPARLRPEVRDAPHARNDAQSADWGVIDPSRDDTFVQGSVRAGWRVAHGVTLTSITAYSQLRTDDYIDRDGMANDNSQYALKGSINAFTQEVRLAGASDRVTWVVGATYNKDKTTERQTVNIETSSNVQSSFGVKFSDASNRIFNDINSWGVFASGDWKLTDTLTLVTGARYTNSSLDFVGCASGTEPAAIQAFGAISAFFRNANGLAPAAFVPANGCLTLGSNFLAVEPHKSLDEDNISWRAALNWRPTTDLTLFASASRGYKSGNSITVAGSSEAQYNPVKQEALTAYEAGIKATLLENTMQLNASVFYYDYKDKQARSKIVDPVFGALQALVNIPESHASGGEIELQWLPVAGLTVNGGVAFLNTEIDEFVGFDALGVRRDFAGHPFSFAPELTGNLDVDYKWALDNGMTASVGGSVSYHSDSSADFESNPLFDIDGYTLLEARASISSKDDAWRLSLWGRNLTDEYYWQSVIRVQDSVVRVPAMPRTVGVTVAATF